MRTRTVVANAIGLAGCAAEAWGVHGLILTVAAVGGSCGDGGPECPPETAYYAIPMAVGLVVSIIASIAGGHLAFAGSFLAIGGGSFATAFELPEGDRLFSYLFGGGFLLMGLLGALYIPVVIAKGRKAMRLVNEGGRAIGTVTAIEDAGMRINDNPRLNVTFSIQPQDGTAAFQGEKAMTLSIVELPYVGQRFPIFYDQADRTTFAVVTQVDATGPPHVQQMFALAKSGEAARPGHPGAAPGGLAPAAHPAAPAAPADPVEQLTKLNDLRLSGALTPAEFEEMKARILGQPDQPDQPGAQYR